MLYYSLHPYPNFHNFCRLKLHWFMMLFTSTPKLYMISIDRKKSIPNPSPAMELKLGSMEIPSSIIWNWWVGEMINYYSRTLTCTVSNFNDHTIYRVSHIFTVVWPQWWSFADVSQQGLDISKQISKRKIIFWYDFPRCSHGLSKSA